MILDSCCNKKKNDLNLGNHTESFRLTSPSRSLLGYRDANIRHVVLQDRIGLFIDLPYPGCRCRNNMAGVSGL